MSKAALMVLILLSGTIAGCTGDPDGGSNDEIDAETISNLEDLLDSLVEPEWINDRGDLGHAWNLSLSDNQWLEVKSAAGVMYYVGDDDDDPYRWTQPIYVMSDDGYFTRSGFMLSFGGNYSLCVDISGINCYNYDLDSDYTLYEWSIIYRIHNTSTVNYYYTGVEQPNPPQPQNVNVTLNVSYVPSGSNDSGRVYGNIVIELFTNDAPLHVDSFVSHIESDAYNHTIFHRVIDGFVIQGGDFQNQDGTGGYAGDWYGYCNGEPATTCDTADMTIPSEADNGLTHGPGTLAMARTSDPDSAGSQFYIVPSDSMPSHLDGAYTVFGQVTSGMEHVDAISEVDTDSSDTPIYDVIIEGTWLN